MPFKLEGARPVPSVCPYCAVGCGLLVHVRDGRIVNIEGDPASPINEGTVCPKGAAAFQLAVNPNRLTQVLYRAPRARAWEVRPLDWAMDRIAQLLRETRERTFVRESGGMPVNRTTAIASIGGAVFDNEENYLLVKLMRGLGVVAIENRDPSATMTSAPPWSTPTSGTGCSIHDGPSAAAGRSASPVLGCSASQRNRPGSCVARSAQLRRRPADTRRGPTCLTAC